ncbi:uncharacterized protein LOC135133782 [Zophobas morio]|uniref:uncharacterized protein LOC135133782 n=1 Tax=Zophobas morio TaxID=2755281 RepID=UPI003083C8DD
MQAHISSPSCFLSSTSTDDNVADYPHHEQNPQLSVTAVLNHCKSKILTPYLRLLSVVGLRPLLANQLEPCFCFRFVNYIYTIQLVFLLIVGYLLQYMACFRRDRGFCFKIANNPYLYQTQIKEIYEKICHAPVVFSFIIPSALHLVAYVHAVVVIRHSEDDQLPVLMERVFLTSTNISNGRGSQRKLVRTLWTFVGLTVIWMTVSFVAVMFMMGSGTINFKWLDDAPVAIQTGLKVLLVTCTLWHDVVQATIISNYCLQTQLLTTYLQFLQEKLLQHPVQPLEWIRHIETFKKMLRYVNIEVAPSVCMFTFINIACATSGILWLFNYDDVDKETVPIVGISTLNVVLWVLLALAPFIQASRLSNECDVLRSAGQEVRTRPFVHQDTPRHDLDSILLYTASLKLRAKLFCMPVTGRYLCLFFVFVGVGVLVLGQCHYFNTS